MGANDLALQLKLLEIAPGGWLRDAEDPAQLLYGYAALVPNSVQYFLLALFRKVLVFYLHTLAIIELNAKKSK